jgi:LysR family transcriptional regulator of abg operon
MRLQQIRHFLAVVEAGTLRGAAARLGLTQPAITKSLRHLEDRVGARLMLRTPRGVVLTPAGRKLKDRARVIEAELRRLDEELAADRGEAEGSVAFGVGPQQCTLLVPDALEHFRRQHAHARVRILEGVAPGLLGFVRDETLDFCVSMAPARKLERGLLFRPLWRPSLVVAGRKGHPLRRATSLRELSDCPWVMYFPLGVGAMLEKAFAAAGAPLPRSIVHCESYAVALSLLAKTDTLGLLFPQVLEDPPIGGPLQQIAVRETIPSPLTGLYTRADAPMGPAAAAMAQAITATARRFARLGR